MTLKFAHSLHLEEVHTLATASILNHFDEIDPKLFSKLSVEMLESLLKQDKLNSSEDNVLNVIIKYLDSVKPNQDDTRRLWLCCRLVHLSSEKQLIAFQHDAFPRDVFCEDFIASKALGRGIIKNSNTTVSSNCRNRIALRNNNYFLRPSMVDYLKNQGNRITPSNAPIVTFKLLPEVGSDINPFEQKIGLPEGWCVVKTTDSDFNLIQQHVIVNLGSVEVYVKNGDCLGAFSGKDGIEPGSPCLHNHNWIEKIGDKKMEEYNIRNPKGRLLVRACRIKLSNKRRPRCGNRKRLYDLNVHGSWPDQPKDDRAPREMLSWPEYPVLNHSDWTILVRSKGCPDRSFKVHKAVLSHGQRASAFLSAQFSNITIDSVTATTVLDICPACLSCIPVLLKYMYGAKLKLKESNVLPLMEMARYFIIPHLGRKCAKWLTNVLQIGRISFATSILLGAIDLRLEKVRDAATAVVRNNFESVDKNFFPNLSIEFLETILKHDILVSSEDHVFDVIVNYLDSVKVETCDSEKLWLCCRFVHLSSEKQVAALQHDTFPRNIFCEDFIVFNAMDGVGDPDLSTTFSPSSRKRVALRHTSDLLRPFMIHNHIVVHGNMITYSNASSVAFKILPETDSNGSIEEFNIPEGWCVVKKTDPDFYLIRKNVVPIFANDNIYPFSECGIEVDEHQHCYKAYYNSKVLVRFCASRSANKRRRI